MGKLSLLGTFLRHPFLVLKMMSMLKSTRLYMNAIVCKHLRDILILQKSKTIQQIMEENNYTNEELFKELMAVLENNKYITVSNDKILLSKPIPQNIVEETEKKLVPEVLDAFATFKDTTEKAISDRLTEKPLDEFDAGELRIKWNIIK